MPQFHFKALGIWGNEEPRREGQYRGFPLCKKAVFSGRGCSPLYGWIIGLITVFDAILMSRQTRQKLQCLYENLMSNTFCKTAVLKKIWTGN